ncbi:MAG: hypothetical protein WEC81_00080 [Patescibacteria group bacterium]
MRKFLFIILGAITLSILPVSLSLTSNTTAEPQRVYAQQNCDSDKAGPCSLAERISEPSGFVFPAWKATRGIINVLLILALLLISFSNISHGLFGLNLDSYTIKKALPNLFLGIILANASMFIIRYLADIATVVVYFFVELARGPGALFSEFLTAVIGTVGIKTIVATQSASLAGVASIIYLILGLVIAVGMIWLAVILYIRLAVVYLLTILSPLAFVAYGIPGMGKYFTQWWQLFIKWLFILPAMCAVFWLMLEIHKSGEVSLIRTVLTYILFFTALTIPTKWGGAIVSKTQNAFKKAGLVAGATSQNLGLDASLAGSNLAKRAEKAKGLRKLLPGAGAGVLKGIGVIAAPTRIKAGLDRRWKGKQKAREFETKQSGLYKRLAGKDARYMDAMEKQFEDLNGLSADDIFEDLKSVDDKGNEIKEKKALQKWFDGLSPKDRHSLLTTPFNSWLAASKNKPPGSLEDAGKFAASMKRYNMESRRRTQRVGGAEALKNAGWDHEKVKQQQADEKGTNPYGNIAGLSATHLTAINNAIKQGKTPEEVAATLGGQYGLDPKQVAAAARDLEADIHLKLHIDHFAGNFGPAASKEIAEAGAKLSEEFDEAFESKSNPSFDRIISSSQEFLKKAGYFGAPDLGGDKQPAEQAAEMQRKVRLVSSGANAVANNQTASATNRLGSSIESMGGQLDQLAGSGASHERQAAVIQDNEQVNQIITNNVTQQAQILNKNLSAEEINNISQNVKNSVLTGLTEKHTLKRIFGSEKFQQTLKNTIISSGIGSQTTTPPPTQDSSAEPPPQETAPVDNSAPPPPEA